MQRTMFKRVLKTLSKRGAGIGGVGEGGWMGSVGFGMKMCI